MQQTQVPALTSTPTGHSVVSALCPPHPVVPFVPLLTEPPRPSLVHRSSLPLPGPSE